MSREVMQMALDVITTPHPGLRTSLSESMIYREKIKTTIEALRACLAQPEKYDQTALELCKKCGWKAVWPDGCLVCEKQKVKPEKEFNPASEKMVCVKEDHKLPKNIPVVNLLYDEIMYAAPHKKEWVDLTDDEINILFKNSLKSVPAGVIWNISRTIEAKLKEKNS